MRQGRLGRGCSLQTKAETSAFQEYEVAKGVRLLVAPTTKFKRTRVTVVVHDRLDPQKTSLGALLPFVQKRGTKSHPTGLALERAAGALYDAELSGAVHKVGDRQLLSYSLDVLTDRLAGEPVFEKGLQLLQEVVYHPAEGEGGLVSDYVEQEKRFQVGRLRSLVNNKPSYARHRCIEEMFRGEPFAEHELGTEDGIAAADPALLKSRHRELLSAHPIDVYVVGDVEVDRVRDLVQQAFGAERGEVVQLGPSKVDRGEGAERSVTDEEQMNQGWLVLGLKSDIDRCHPNRYGLLFFNGILGGFVHSKLFVNVREKASLAYAAASSLNANKGILLALAGIDVKKYDQALEIMKRQIEDTVKGAYTDEELEATRRALLTQYRMRLDSADARILFHAGGTVEGCPETIEESLAAIERVGRADIAAAGERLRLDTVYFLKGVL